MINADVLDAWFAPSPRVIEALRKFEPWSASMSPPTHAEGFVEAIGGFYGIPSEQVLVGAGSSALWFLYALTTLNRDSKVLLIEPSYGEYGHVCRSVVGCETDILPTSLAEGFALDLGRWVSQLQKNRYDLAVLINPNNPTGIGIPRNDLLNALQQVPSSTQILIDEAYMDYWNPNESLILGDLPSNVTVISSFSKRFALSGLRVAMMRTSPEMRARLQTRTPPWAVSLPAQIAGCAALKSTDYYRQRYDETHRLRDQLRVGLQGLGYQVIDTCANWLMFRVSDAEGLCKEMASKSLYVRNIGLTAPSLGNDWVRIAVKDEATIIRMLDIIG